MKAIIFDIDGTLANIDHRLHYIKGGKKDWKSFYEACVDDILIEPVNSLLQVLAAANVFDAGNTPRIIFVSGRPEDYWEQTTNWIYKHTDIYPRHLYMRKSGDFRRDDIVKEEILKQLQAEGYEIVITIDDRQRVVDMWRRNGITCFQCAQWGEEESELPEKPGDLYLMVGPSGAGKTSFIDSWRWADKQAKIYKELGMMPQMVLSSDILRLEMCGDFLDQTKNDQVFGYIHATVRTRSRYGLSTVIDATNIRDADRRSLRDCVPNNSVIHYIVVDRPLPDKLKTAGWRSEVVVKGKPLVVRHHEVMQANLKNILRGDGDERVVVHDFRT